MESEGTWTEQRLAEEIVKVLPEGTWARVCTGDREALRYAVRSDALRLRSVVLSRASLRRLLADPARDVKIEYLQRDLLRDAARRGEYRYPRLTPAKRRDQPPASLVSAL